MNMATATKQQLIDRIKQMPDNLPIIVADDDGAICDNLRDWDLEDFVKVEKVSGHFDEDGEFCIDNFNDAEKHEVILING